jgi:hypothetical protein
MYIRLQRCCFRGLACESDLLAYTARYLRPGLMAFLREVSRDTGDVTGGRIGVLMIGPSPTVPRYDSFPLPNGCCFSIFVA